MNTGEKIDYVPRKGCMKCTGLTEKLRLRGMEWPGIVALDRIGGCNEGINHRRICRRRWCISRN